MADTFRAILLSKTDGGQRADEVHLSLDELMPGNVLVEVEASTLNYKDGLAITGQVPVVRRWPMIPGIDLAGRVLESTAPEVVAGEMVIVNGWGLGEVHYGGYAERARIDAGWTVPLPRAFTAAEAMAIGTAGYTAMLCVLAIEDHGLAPGDGKVLVTGAAGGVGSVAVALLAKLGYHVVAVTGRESEGAYLERLGAKEILPRTSLEGEMRPLAKELWAGAVDVAGGRVLANVISQMRYGGVVAACGLAASMDLPTTVMPFILRGVTLAGIDSVMLPRPRRLRAWTRLAEDLDLELLHSMTTDVGLSEVLCLAPEILRGQVRGRTVVKIK